MKKIILLGAMLVGIATFSAKAQTSGAGAQDGAQTGRRKSSRSGSMGQGPSQSQGRSGRKGKTSKATSSS